MSSGKSALFLRLSVYDWRGMGLEMAQPDGAPGNAPPGRRWSDRILRGPLRGRSATPRTGPRRGSKTGLPAGQNRTNQPEAARVFGRMESARFCPVPWHGAGQGAWQRFVDADVGGVSTDRAGECQQTPSHFQPVFVLVFRSSQARPNRISGEGDDGSERAGRRRPGRGAQTQPAVGRLSPAIVKNFRPDTGPKGSLSALTAAVPQRAGRRRGGA